MTIWGLLNRRLTGDPAPPQRDRGCEAGARYCGVQCAAACDIGEGGGGGVKGLGSEGPHFGRLADRTAPARCIPLMSPAAGRMADVSFSTSLHATDRRGALGWHRGRRGLRLTQRRRATKSNEVAAECDKPGGPILLDAYRLRRYAARQTESSGWGGRNGSRSGQWTSWTTRPQWVILFSATVDVIRAIARSPRFYLRRHCALARPMMAPIRLVHQDRPVTAPRAGFAVFGVQVLHKWAR